MKPSQTLLNNVTHIAYEAGEAIMSVYQREFAVEEKADHSPLTEADLAAHRTILSALDKLSPRYPVLSEESDDIAWETRRQWDTYWLVDPLDGTKEFIKRNGEFTVNIALIHQHRPVLGVVYAPALNLLYSAAQGIGAFKREAQQPIRAIRCAPAAADKPLRIVGSRSHKGASTQVFLDRLGRPYEWVGMGSSLKFCLIAEGQADLYPRMGPTSEWDTAAAQAVLEQAGGRVCLYEHDGLHEALRYNARPSLINPEFVATALDEA